MRFGRIIFIACVICFGSWYMLMNIKDFQKLAKHTGKFPSKKVFYKEVFRNDTTVLKPLLSYEGNEKISPLQSYTDQNKFDILLYKIKDMEAAPNLVSFVQQTEPFGAATGVIYDGSYKGKQFRFYTLLDHPKKVNHLTIGYIGDVTTKPLVKENLISYSLSANKIQGLFNQSEKPYWYLDKRIPLTKFSVEITFFKQKDNGYFIMLTFPKDNAVITQHPSTIDLITL